MKADESEPPIVPSPAVCAQIAALAPDVTSAHLASLGQFLTYLRERNRLVNLTAIRAPEEMWQRHVLDSLALLPWLPQTGHVIDLGSGGGFPAVPLAISRPELSYCLVEATGKKAKFLAEATEKLGLDGVEVLQERIETVGRGPRRASAQIVTARAVARLPTLLELAIPLLEVGGRLLAIKGAQASAEVQEAERALCELNAEPEQLVRTPTGTVVIVRKLAPTGQRYPRPTGEPKRKPLV